MKVKEYYSEPEDSILESEDSNSDTFNEELESELYSVLHYNNFSQGISSNILDKYDIKVNKQREYLITFKNCKSTNTISKEYLVDTNSVSDSESSSVNENSHTNDQEVIEISDDDEDNDSVIILEETNPLVDLTSISSPEESDSSFFAKMDDSIVLNISPAKDMCTDSNDTENASLLTKVKWKETVCPSNWTTKMKAFYNKPVDRLLKFDYVELLKEIRKTSDKGDWWIDHKDKKTYRKGYSQRCAICKQTDHQTYDCPRSVIQCYMCGDYGHESRRCPMGRCLNCGRKNYTFVESCNRCKQTASKTKACNVCCQNGHFSEECPDTWRRYSSTTEANLEIVVQEEKLNDKIFCCNCAKSGHLFENCPNYIWSYFPPTSFLIKDKKDISTLLPPVVKKSKNSKKRFQENRKRSYHQQNQTSTPLNYHHASTSMGRQFHTENSFNPRFNDGRSHFTKQNEESSLNVVKRFKVCNEGDSPKLPFFPPKRPKTRYYNSIQDTIQDIGNQFTSSITHNISNWESPSHNSNMTPKMTPNRKKKKRSINSSPFNNSKSQLAKKKKIKKKKKRASNNFMNATF